MFTSVPSNENVASFLFEKQYALIYQVVVSRSFFELETIRNTVRSTFTLIMHQLCYFRPVLPLHSTYPIDLQSKSVTCFLCNENTTNPRHDIFHILFPTLLKTFFTPFPKFTTQSDFTKTQLKLYLTTDTNSFMTSRTLTKLSFIPFPIY